MSITSERADTPRVLTSDEHKEISDRWIYPIIIFYAFLGIIHILAAANGKPSSFGIISVIASLFVIYDYTKIIERAGLILSWWRLVLGWLVPPCYLYFRAGLIGRGMKYLWIALAAIFVPAFIAALIEG